METCKLCRPICLPREVFDHIKHLSFPAPGEDGHYKAFPDVFGSDASEEFRLSQKMTKKKANTLPFYASVQHVKNSQLMVQCEECNMWRLVFSKYKLKAAPHQRLQQVIGDYSYTCGAKLEDLNLGEEFKNVDVKDHSCGDPIEKLYYSAGFDPICVYCAVEQTYTSQEHYPQCEACSHLPQIKK